MLPPFIIDQIRRREEDERQKREQDQPRLELPLDIYQPAREPASDDPGSESGIIILDLG